MGCEGVWRLHRRDRPQPIFWGQRPSKAKTNSQPCRRLPTKPAGFRQRRSLSCIGRGHHRIIACQTPFLSVFVWGQPVMGTKVSLQQFELLPVLEADDVVGKHRTLRINRRLLLGSSVPFDWPIPESDEWMDAVRSGNPATGRGLLLTKAETMSAVSPTKSAVGPFCCSVKMSLLIIAVPPFICKLDDLCNRRLGREFEDLLARQCRMTNGGFSAVLFVLSEPFEGGGIQRFFVVVAYCFLAACQNSAGTVTDKHLGVTVAHSRIYPIKNGLLYNLQAFVGHSDRKGYTIALTYTSTGLGWMFFREAWSFGKQYEYVVAAENLAGCGSGACSMIEQGGIRLSESDVQKAAANGFEFKLLGKGGSVEAKVPPEAFQQVLEQVARPTKG